MATRQETVRLNRVLPRIEAPVTVGLSGQQARERLENGYGNMKPESAEKTIAQILRGNIFTYLNLLLTTLAICLMLVGSFAQLTFLPVIMINTVIGIIQELRAKRALAKLTFITAPNATVIRDGVETTVRPEDAVLDDIAMFAKDQQIYADAVVLAGEVSVNEALVTGESDEITKKPGDTLLSGSFIISGECAARLDRVGRDSFVAQLTLEAKKTKGKLSAGMVATLKRFVQIIGIIMVPVGITMFVRQVMQEHIYVTTATETTVGALVGMVPDGLYLLVSVALTVSVLRLARRRTLVQERNCIETLARVNVLCVDKTGTITENNMDVKGIALLNEDRFSEEDVVNILADYSGNMSDENETMTAIKSYINMPARRNASNIMPFSSAVKYGGVSFSDGSSYVLGAPERILQSKYYKYQSIIEAHSARGYRVLLLAMSGSGIGNKLSPESIMPLALVLLSNKVRAEAPPTFEFFAKQGVKIIVISGDNPVTVSHIALEAGIIGAEKYIDAAELQTDRQIKKAVSEYVVFGRVTPDQKRKLVRALKRAGNTVAMTGDGVNDVLALKDSDCSIAMASGSEVASQVSDIVLLDSDFSAMPHVVMEGRRVINNLERSAALFITKNIFTLLFVLAVTIPFGALFPLRPNQFTLFNVMFIGIPSFVLAMEVNKSIVRGKFLINAFRHALPAGLTSFVGLVSMFYFSSNWDMPIYQVQAEASTVSLIIIGFVGMLMLIKLCLPFNILRIALCIAMLIGFVGGIIILSGLEIDGVAALAPLSSSGIWLTVLTCLAMAPIFFGLTLAFRNMGLRK
ncbi:MAG: HAD-IC family P-type ATPase [Oscillospiraceae bacterium]|nr:HAD-IC family P-type ATPase [Oscillospiraceae bacterium]